MTSPGMTSLGHYPAYKPIKRKSIDTCNHNNIIIQRQSLMTHSLMDQAIQRQTTGIGISLSAL